MPSPSIIAKLVVLPSEMEDVDGTELPRPVLDTFLSFRRIGNKQDRSQLFAALLTIHRVQLASKGYIETLDAMAELTRINGDINYTSIWCAIVGKGFALDIYSLHRIPPAKSASSSYERAQNDSPSTKHKANIVFKAERHLEVDFYREERKKRDGAFHPDAVLKAEAKKVKPKPQPVREGRFRRKYSK